MNRPLTHSLLISLLIFLTIGPIKLPLPFFSDIRKMIILPLAFGLIYFLLNSKTRIKLFDLAQSPVGITLLIFTLIVSISSAVNVPSDGFKSVSSYLFGIMAFFFGYAILFAVNQPEKLLKTFMVVVISISMFAVINSILILVLGKPFIVFSNAFITDKITEYRLYDYARGRLYMISSIDLFIPFIASVFLGVSRNTKKQLILMIALALGILTIFLNNYRGKVLTGVIGLYLVYILNNASKKTLFAMILIPFALSLFIQVKTGNIIDRFLLTNREDRTSVASRMAASAKAFNLGIYNPFLGVGLGNFINYADWVWTSKDKTAVVSYQNPHNAHLTLFTETGFVSTMIYVILIVKMVKSDLNFLVKPKSDSNNIILPFIVSSWIFIQASAIDWYPANYIVYFFLLRGLIHGAIRIGPRPKLKH